MAKSLNQFLRQTEQANSDPSPPDLSIIQLTDAELNAAILSAKLAKKKRLEIAEAEQNRKERKERWLGQWSSGEFKNFVWSRLKFEVPAFTVDESNKQVLEALALYFNNDPHFENINAASLSSADQPLPLSLKKGIYLWGPIGAGKTAIMQGLSQNKRICYQVVSCRKFIRAFIEHGLSAIEPFRHILFSLAPSMDNFFQREHGVCFDDLGTESDNAANYGNRTNVMADIILDRYDNKVPFYHTHITTNLGVQEIEDRYGKRVRSRMREMFNIIELNGNDRRV